MLSRAGWDFPRWAFGVCPCGHMRFGCLVGAASGVCGGAAGALQGFADRGEDPRSLVVWVAAQQVAGQVICTCVPASDSRPLPPSVYAPGGCGHIFIPKE